jgi:DNA-binding MarR family transcriptional regulator
MRREGYKASTLAFVATSFSIGMRAHACTCRSLWLFCVIVLGAMASQSPSRPSHTVAQVITPQQQDAWFALLFAHATVTARIDRELQEAHGISFSATEILCRLHDEEPQSVRALADQLVSVSPTRASRLVQELVDAGYLQRGSDQGDGRKSLISFTSKGRRYSEKVARTLESAILKYFVEPLDDEDVQAIVRIWEKLRAAQAAELSATSR